MRMTKAADRETSVGDLVDWYNGKALYLYSGGARFESGLGHLLY
jgi:hypothetical protein